MGFADPQAEIGYGYVPNQVGSHLVDPRDRALRTALYRSTGEPRPFYARSPEESVFQSTTS